MIELLLAVPRLCLRGLIAGNVVLCREEWLYRISTVNSHSIEVDTRLRR